MSAEEKGTANWKDHFSHASDDYRRWRPRYPDELFAWLASQSPATDLALDCATGSGQAAESLAAHFTGVLATDASEAQIRQTEPHARIDYRVAPAEKIPLGDASVDLVTVAQALHWFDIDRFHLEARRVMKPGAVIAEWGYQLACVDDAIDVAVCRFSEVTVGPWWPPERAWIDTAYAGIPFPFEKIDAPAFAMTARWRLDRYIAYVGTWSSVNGYRREKGVDPLPALREELAPRWGEGERELRWPLMMRVGRS